MREPRQERGQRRVEEILDATEALILEVGAAACSVQELASRSGASVGSIYHFFPTKEAIFDALRERYAREARVIAERIRNDAADWSVLDLPAFVERLISPFVDFFEHHPAQYELATAGTGQRVSRDATIHAIVREALEVALARRWPDTAVEERSLRVDVIAAIGSGISTLLLQATPGARARISRELPRAILGYLSTFG